MSDDPLTPKQIAEMANEFTESLFGKWYLSQLSGKYNELHHQAESEELGVDQKAAKVDRAAGVKKAIDIVMERRQRYLSGEFDKKDGKSA